LAELTLASIVLEQGGLKQPLILIYKTELNVLSYRSLERTDNMLLNEYNFIIVCSVYDYVKKNPKKKSCSHYRSLFHCQGPGSILTR